MVIEPELDVGVVMLAVLLDRMLEALLEEMLEVLLEEMLEVLLEEMLEVLLGRLEVLDVLPVIPEDDVWATDWTEQLKQLLPK